TSHSCHSDSSVGGIACAGVCAKQHSGRQEKGYKPSQPEPWLAPKYKSPSGTVKPIKLPESTVVPMPNTQVPPDLYVPQTGRVVPNLPTVSGSGRGGAETFQDRASRCAHQAGVFGQSGGDRGSYIGACVNQ